MLRRYYGCKFAPGDSTLVISFRLKTLEKGVLHFCRLTDSFVGEFFFLFSCCYHYRLHGDRFVCLTDPTDFQFDVRLSTRFLWFFPLRGVHCLCSFRRLPRRRTHLAACHWPTSTLQWGLGAVTALTTRLVLLLRLLLALSPTARTFEGSVGLTIDVPSCCCYCCPQLKWTRRVVHLDHNQGVLWWIC